MEISESARVLGEAIDRLERAWLPAELLPHSDFFAYQPTSIQTFMEDLEVAQRFAPGKQWMEIGCGIGTKLIIASQCGFSVHGIEVREQYIAVAKHLCPEAKYEVADARYYDGYAAFDVIHCYRPIISEEGQHSLEEHLTKQMRRDAVLILPHRNVFALGWRLADESKNGHVWVRNH